MKASRSDPQALAAFIRRSREAAGLTQQQVADQMPGFERTYISQLERAKVRLPSQLARQLLADILGITELDIMVHAGELPAREVAEQRGRQLPPLLALLLPDLEALNDRNLEVVRLVVRGLLDNQDPEMFSEEEGDGDGDGESQGVTWAGAHHRTVVAV